MARPNRSTRGLLAGLAALALILAVVAGVLGYLLWQDQTPGDESAEAGFLRDMQVHHTQAVEMAMIIRDRTDDAQLKAMATDIAFTQTSEMGMMQGYLNLWDLNPTGSDPAMTWMGHPTTGLMPGMATPEQVNLLRTLPVDQAEVLFLQLMNRHHIAGVGMAQAIIDKSDNAKIEQLAQAMIRTQDAEISIMNQMLEQRGAQTVTPDNASTIQLPVGTPGASPAATPSEEHTGH
jgi:uncharacterized protein (DUF305 family)